MAFRRDTRTTSINNMTVSPQGFLKIDANLSKVGIFTYLKSDGTMVRELRLPEDVFNQKSLDSAESLPVTVGHPPTMVNPSNVRQYKIGQSITPATPSADTYVSAKLQIEDADVIQKVQDGALPELSCGYTTRLEMTPGIWNGQAYDAIQRDIVLNHVSLLGAGEGRQGSDVGLRLDSGAAIQVEDSTMHTILVDNKPYNVDEKVAAAFAAMRQSLDSYVAKETAAAEEAAKKAEDEAKAKAAADEAGSKDPNEASEGSKEGTSEDPDKAKEGAEAGTKTDSKELGALQVRLDQSEKALKDAQDKFDAYKADEAKRMAARIALEGTAKPFLAKDYVFTDKTDRQVRVDTLAACGTKVEDSKDDTWVEGAFAVVVQTKQDSDNGIRNLVVPNLDGKDAKKDEIDPEKAKQERLASQQFSKLRAIK